MNGAGVFLSGEQVRANEMSESLMEQAFREFKGAKCVCGAEKINYQSFCRDCHVALPQRLRSDLYHHRGLADGYPEIYEEAKRWLSTQTQRLNQRLLGFERGA